MGAGGNRNFENDQAMDFAVDFTEKPLLESLQEAFATVIGLGQENEYMEVDEASAALAAAEILATKLGKPAPDFPAALQPALTALQPTASLQKLAGKAVKQVVKESELQELWAEGEDREDWLAVQADLLGK